MGIARTTEPDARAAAMGPGICCSFSGVTRRVSYRMATLSRDDGEREDSQ